MANEDGFLHSGNMLPGAHRRLKRSDGSGHESGFGVGARRWKRHMKEAP